MGLNFTGRASKESEAQPPVQRRGPVVAAAIFGVAAMLAGLVFFAAARQQRIDAPPPLPPLVGGDQAVATAPATHEPAAAQPAWIMHKAAPVAAPQPVQAAPEPAPARPSAQDTAAAKARMLAALRQVPHGQVTLQIEDDPVAKAYGDRLASLFREAGWTVDMSSVFGSGPPRRGIAAAFGISPSDEAVREAFDAVGFQFQAPPRDSITRTPEIFVGAP